MIARQQSHDSQMQQDKQGGAGWIAQDYMCDWLMSNKILDEIFVRNVHTEVLKRSMKVLAFLASNHRLGELEIKMIWDASLGQHESISKMIHELLSKTASQLHSPDVLLRMLRLIRQHPVASFTAQHVVLAKRIAQILVQLGTRMQQMHADDQFAGIEFLWIFMQDDLRLAIELQNMCTTSFTHLIAMNECRVVRAEYFEKCIKNLKEHKSLMQSLAVMNSLFVSLASKRKRPDVDWSTFGCVQDEQELLSLIIDDLVQYRNSSSATEGLDSAGSTPRTQTPREAGTPRASSVRRPEQITKRLEFITSILQLQGTSLPTQHLETLWKTLVQPGIDGRQRDVSLKWFHTLLDNQWTREAMAPSLETLFHLTCSLVPSDVSECAFELFRKALLQVNFKQGKIVYEGPERNTVIVATRGKLLGTDFLWQVSVSAHVLSVADHAIGLLNEIYHGVSSNMPNHLEVLQERRQEHVAACLDHMLSAADDLNKGDAMFRSESASAQARARDENRISRCICVLRKFLHDFELRAAVQSPDLSIRKHGRQLLGGQISLRLQQFGQTAGEAVAMQIDRGAALWLLRELAGKTLGEDQRSIRMIAKGKELKGDQKTVAEFRLSDGDTVHWTKKCSPTRPENDVDMEAGPAAPAREKSLEFRPPHDILSQDHFHKIFELLDMPPKISMQVWELLMVLPTNQRLMEQIRALGPSLASTLCPSGVFTQLYTLQIVEILLFEDDSSNNQPSWRANFTQSGGVTHLLEMILSQRFSQQDSDQCNDCLAKLLNLLYMTMIDSPRHRSDARNAPIPCIESYFKDSKQMESCVHILLNSVRVSAAAANGTSGTPGGGEARGTAAGRLTGYETVANNAMQLLVACVSRARQMASYICTYESSRAWLADTVVHTQTAGIRQVVCQGVLRLARPDEQEWQAYLASDASSDSPPCLHPHLFFLEHLLKLVCTVAPGTSRCTDFFDLVNQIVNMTEKLLSSLDEARKVSEVLVRTLGAQFDETANGLVTQIKGSGVVEERNGTTEDEVLFGNLRILRSICNLRPQLKAEIGGSVTKAHPDRCGLVAYLTSECLFGLPSVEQYAPLGPPKCKMPKTRSAAFDLLFTLSDACPPNQKELVAVLHHQHLRREYRSLSMYRPWLYDRAPCGFVGLRNLGATCYMNSLLQQLFSVPECRSNMLKVHVEDRDSFMYQLKLLFAHLQESEKQFYDPWDLCQVYTDYDGQPVNISQQMDVDEFLNVLFEKVEQGLKNTPQKDLLRDCFGGKIVHQIICKEPVTVGEREYTVQDPYKSEREESFYTLQLEVKHKRSILESLRLYVDGEALEGDNKYLCEEADKKVDAVKRICIKELPQTLILHLKRFEFDLDFMKKVKVNDCCEFPLRLDMDPYTLDGIERREKAAADAIQQGLDGIKAMEEVESAPDSEYELVGVLVHTGTADSGHYYSYIRERTDDDPAETDDKVAKWHLFNDIHVEPFDSKELGAASFGGSEYVEEPDPSDSTRPQTKVISRSYSAYMLFYERRSAKHSASRKALKREGARAPASKDGASKDIMDLVLQENIRFLRDKHTYDPEYFAFLKKVCAMPLEEPAVDDKATMLAVHVLMDCMIHSWDMDQVGEWVSIIQGKLSPEEVKRSKWLLDAFTQAQEVDGRLFGQHWLKKGLLSHRAQECRLSLVQLLVHAINTLVPFERQNEMVIGAVPYCDVNEDEDSEITVMQNQELVFSLWTDHPYERAREYRGSPFPRPVTTVGKFIESVLDLLASEVPRYWRNCSEYFLLLSKFADMGPDEKTFLLSRRTISRCIESVLLDDSSNGARKAGNQFSAPDYDHLLALISTLARSVQLERDMLDEQENKSPTQICHAGPLDPACNAYIRKPRVLTKVLSEGINPTETLRLIEHLCWNNNMLSASVLETLISVLDDAHEDEMEALFNMLDKLVAMKDVCQEARAERMVALFLRNVLDKLPYADTLARCLEFLERLVARSSHVRVAVLKSIMNPRREQQMQLRWFETCLIRSDVEKVQVAWEKIARTIALPEVFRLRQAALKQHGKSAARMPSVPKVQGDDYTKTFFDHLVSKNEKMVMIGCQDPRETGCGPYPLRYYLRLLYFIIDNTGGRWYKDKFRDRFRLFHDVLRRLNELEGETDFAKAELFRLMLAAADGHSELLDIYTDDRSAVRRAFVGNFILIRPHRINISFNRQNLPSFYKLLLACCQHRASFIEYLMEANEFIWAIQQLMCKSAKYPETAAVILELIDMILDSTVQPEKVGSFRERVSEVLLSANDLSASPASVVELSNRFLIHLLGDTDGMYKILDSHLIDAMLAAIGSCYSPHAAGGQRPRTPPEARTLEVAMQGIEIIEKIMAAVKSHEGLDAAVSESVNKAVRDALCRNRDPANDNRLKALQGIMYVILPTVDLLTSKERLQALQVAKFLCLHDIGCCNVAADVLVKLFNETKLRQVEHVRLEHLHGDAAQDASSGADGDACTQAQQAEQAWLSIRRHAQVEAMERVMEYGPACRARPGGSTKQEHNEIESAYCDLSLALCQSLICQAHNSNNHMFYAVHLILRCALDFLPLAKLGVHRGLQKLLLQCLKASTSPEEKEQSSQPAQGPAAGSTAQQTPALPNGAMFVHCLKQDNAAFSWVERVMVCYKESIELDVIRDCVRLMLSTLAPAWPADVIRRINAFLVHDLADLARAACVLREAGDVDTLGPADKRAECVARAVLREIRPLSVLGEIPTMLQLLVEDHGETACIAAAEEALEAAECRKLAPSSKKATAVTYPDGGGDTLASCLAEIDSILHTHREALADRSNKPGAR